MTNIDIDKLFNSAKQDALPLQLNEVEDLVKNYKPGALKVNRFNIKIIYSVITGIIVVGSILIYHFQAEKPTDLINVKSKHINKKEVLIKETVLIGEKKAEEVNKQENSTEQILSVLPSKTEKTIPVKNTVFTFPSKLGKNQRIIEKKLSVSNVANSIGIRNYAGNIILKNWDKDVVQLKALITVVGDSDEDVKLCLENLNVKLEKSKHGSLTYFHSLGDHVQVDPINLSSGLNNENDIHQNENMKFSNNVLKNGQITFVNGQLVKVDSFTIDYEVTVPKKTMINYFIFSLNHNIDILGECRDNLTIGINNAQVNILKPIDTLSLNLTNSSAYINSFDQGELNVKNSTVILKEGGGVILSGGKSNVDLQEVKTLDDKGFKKDEAYKYSISYKK